MSTARDFLLGEVLQIFDGPHATPRRLSVGPYFLNIASLNKGRLDLSRSDHVSVEDFKKWTKRVTPMSGDLLFSYETRLGEAALMPEKIQACLGRRMGLLRPDPEKIDSHFLLYYYLSPAFKKIIDQHTIHGATVNRIPLITMGQWVVCLPPLLEQQAIAEVLGALDDKIAANTRLSATANDLISVSYLIALQAGQIRVPLLEEFDVEYGEPFAGVHFSELGTGRPLIRIRDLKTYRSQVWTTESRPREAVVDAGDVIVGMDAEFRATSWLGEPGLLNQRVCRFSHREYGNALVREAIKRPLAEVEKEKSATTVIHLNKSDLARKTALLPVGEALKVFETQAEPIYELATLLALEGRNLAATRDALLPKLMSGQIRVKDAEKLAEEAGA